MRQIEKSVGSKIFMAAVKTARHLPFSPPFRDFVNARSAAGWPLLCFNMEYEPCKRVKVHGSNRYDCSVRSLTRTRVLPKLKITDLLRPHYRALGIGLL